MAWNKEAQKLLQHPNLQAWVKSAAEHVNEETFLMEEQLNQRYVWKVKGEMINWSSYESWLWRWIMKKKKVDYHTFLQENLRSSAKCLDRIPTQTHFTASQGVVWRNRKPTHIIYWPLSFLPRRCQEEPNVQPEFSGSEACRWRSKAFVEAAMSQISAEVYIFDRVLFTLRGWAC